MFYYYLISYCTLSCEKKSFTFTQNCGLSWNKFLPGVDVGLCGFGHEVHKRLAQPKTAAVALAPRRHSALACFLEGNDGIMTHTVPWD